MLASSRAATSSGTLERSSRNASSRRCTRISLPSYNQSGSSLLKFKAFVRLFTHIQLLPVLENGEETTLVGGQAVMEGVMMRSPHSYCVAVRTPDGEITVKEEPLPRLTDRHPILKWPVLRGLATLGGAMWLGMKALKFSADCALGKAPEETNDRKEPARGAMALQILFSLLFM